MGTSSGLVEQQPARHLVPPGVGANKHLDRELKYVFAFLILGWLAALASLVVYGLIAQGVSETPFAILPEIFPGNSLLFIAGGAAVLPLIVLLIWRLWAGRRSVFQKRSGCPVCAEQDFVRIHRHRFERAASKLTALSTQRLACRNCAWVGLLVSSESQGVDDVGRDEGMFVGAAAPAVFVDTAADDRELSSASDAIEAVEVSRDVVVTAGTAAVIEENVPASGDGLNEDTVVVSEESLGVDEVVLEAFEDTAAEPVAPPAVDEIILDETASLDDILVEESTPIVEGSIDDAPVEEETLDDDNAGEEVAPAVTERVPPLDNGVLYVTAANGDIGQIALTPLPKRSRALAQPDSVDEGSKAADREIESSGKQEEVDAELFTIDPGAPRAIVTAPFGLKLRREPRTDAEVLKVVAVDSIVTVLVEEGDAKITTWQQVSAGGTTGWASSAFLRRLTNGGSSPVR